MYDLTDEKINELQNLIDEIDKFDGKWLEINNLPYAFTHDLAKKAMKFLYDNKLIINFDWGKWDEGRTFFKNNDPNKYDNIDREFTLKLLTAVARNDRFCDGAWGNLFESGTALILFKKLFETYEKKT
jgi:hypothetical protein